MNNTSHATIGMTLLRVITGFIFVAHGWQKYTEYTLAGTQASFAQMGIPLANIAAPAIATLELIGGLALILGFLTKPIAALLTLNMLGALVLVHGAAGLFVANNGYELVLILGAAALTLVLVGPGRISVDHAIFGRTTTKMRALA